MGQPIMANTVAQCTYEMQMGGASQKLLVSSKRAGPPKWEAGPPQSVYQEDLMLANTKLTNGARCVTVRVEFVGIVVDASFFVLHGQGEVTTVACVIHNFS